MIKYYVFLDFIVWYLFVVAAPEVSHSQDIRLILAYFMAFPRILYFHSRILYTQWKYDYFGSSQHFWSLLLCTRIAECYMCLSRASLGRLGFGRHLPLRVFALFVIPSDSRWLYQVGFDPKFTTFCLRCGSYSSHTLPPPSLIHFLSAQP